MSEAFFLWPFAGALGPLLLILAMVTIEESPRPRWSRLPARQTVRVSTQIARRTTFDRAA